MILILSAFLMLAVPSTNELGIYPDSRSIEVELMVNKLEFIETRIELIPAEEDNGHKQRFSIWMPSKIVGDYVLVSRPGIITHETVVLAHDLLRSM